MGVKAHISKWGTSLAVRIPKPIAQQWGVQEGSPIGLSLKVDVVNRSELHTFVVT